ncbi:MAG TPA: hypothetical protein VM681_08655 [Candidatus Thermoplasmatota archaeon]|nr:hypothetical protein [Candidatus Thermoplasmatota archaeon]
MSDNDARLFLADDVLGWISIFLLFLGVMFVLAQLPHVLAGTAQFSGWQYVFPITAFVAGIKSKRDAVAWAAVLHFSLLFLVDVFYGVGGI